MMRALRAALAATSSVLVALVALFTLGFVPALVACGGPDEPKSAATAASTPPPASTTPPPAPATPVPELAKDERPADPAPQPPRQLEAVPPTVKLIEPGAAPRRVLRYKFKAGVTEYAEMDMKMAMTLSMGGKAAPRATLPTVRMLLRLDAKEVSPEGDLRATFETQHVELLKDAPADPKLLANLDKEMQGLVGLHGKARISPRGVASETEFDLPPTASATLKGQIDNMRDAVRQMYVPFPEEEVGEGAKWEVTSRIPISGAMMDSKMLYTMLKSQPDVMQANVETTLSGEPHQTMSLGALPPGAKATLESLSGKATTKVASPLTRLVGTSNASLGMESTFSITMKDEKAAMKMQTDMTMAMRPGKARAAAPKK